MNKKDILDLAQREKRDEGEDAMENKSRRIGSLEDQAISLAVIFLCLCLIILNNHFGRENDSLNALLCTMAAVEFYVRFAFTKKISDLVLALIGTVFVILSLVAYVTAVVSGA